MVGLQSNSGTGLELSELSIAWEALNQERPDQSLPGQIILEPAPPAMAPGDSSGLVLELGAYDMSTTSPCAPTAKFEVIRSLR